MPDKIFTVIGSSEYDINSKKKEINEFLERNSDYEVKSVTPIIKSADNSAYQTFGGAIVVVGERK